MISRSAGRPQMTQMTQIVSKVICVIRGETASARTVTAADYTRATRFLAQNLNGLVVRDATRVDNHEVQANQNFAKKLEGHPLLAHGTRTTS